MNKLFKTKYGYFTGDGKEYVITRPDTPRPWINAISNGDYGLVISQTGSGYSFRGNSNLARINTWIQDLIRDDYGKYIYIRDNDSKKIWSIGWKPTCPKFAKYEVRHGIGYTVITSLINGIEAEMIIFVPLKEPVEIWKVTLRNKTNKKRTLSLFTYFELCLGNPNAVHKEYHKTFIGTEYDKSLGAMFADKRREVNRKISDRNLSEWPCNIFHSASVKPKNCEGDKENFLGNYGTTIQPKAVAENRLTGTTGRWSDPICSLQVEVSISANSEKTVVFTLGETKNKAEAARIIKKYKNTASVDRSLEEVKKMWDSLLSGLTVETPDPAMNLMVNVWLKYQAIAGRLWARCAYYQSSGAIGFRDQLQDAQIFFYLKPELAKKQILLHAAHQYYAGTVYHWWHTLTEWGLDTGFSDDLLWLPYITLNYIDETEDYKILNEAVEYLDAPAEPLYDHCLKAINKVLSRFSKRGLPLIGEGDWNDGLSSVGVNWKGESIWLGHFLYGILGRFAEICLRKGDKKSYDTFLRRREMLKKAINRYAWDGKWYILATSDNGKLLGSSKSKEGKIHLNPQTWSIIHGTAIGGRGETAMKSAEKLLYREYGPLLLAPAYTEPDQDIGYLTRYAAGTRENGGVYSHAATWAIMAECMLKRNKKAYNIYKKMIPPNRGVDPDFYKGEPYVMPGNIDGPDSANFGRSAWTWYTGSAAWMLRVITEWILGVRPGKGSLIVDPCIPDNWKGFKMRRLFRGKMYEIKVKREKNGKFDVRINPSTSLGMVLPRFTRDGSRDGERSRTKNMKKMLSFLIAVALMIFLALSFGFAEAVSEPHSRDEDIIQAEEMAQPGVTLEVREVPKEEAVAKPAVSDKKQKAMNRDAAKQAKKQAEQAKKQAKIDEKKAKAEAKKQAKLDEKARKEAEKEAVRERARQEKEADKKTKEESKLKAQEEARAKKAERAKSEEELERKRLTDIQRKERLYQKIENIEEKRNKEYRDTKGLREKAPVPAGGPVFETIPDDIAELIKKGDEFYNNGDYDSAREYYDKARFLVEEEKEKKKKK